MKYPKTTAVVHIALALACLSMTNLAGGCTCIPTTVQSSVADADVVFRGTIVGLHVYANPIGRDLPAVRIAVFIVTRVWKGNVGKKIEVRVGGDPFCQSFPKTLMSVGSELLVYANKQTESPEYSASICSRTAFANGASDFEELGRGRAPHRREIGNLNR